MTSKLKEAANPDVIAALLRGLVAKCGGFTKEHETTVQEYTAHVLALLDTHQEQHDAGVELERARRNGFVQGQAWACAVMLRYELDENQLLAESSLSAESMQAAGVDPYDAEPILAAIQHTGGEKQHAEY